MFMPGERTVVPALPDVLWLPDVNILIHAAGHARRVFGGLPGSFAQMLHAFDASADDALKDLVTAVVARSMVTCDLMLGTAMRVLTKDLGWNPELARDMLTMVALASHRVPVSRWDEVRPRALGPMRDLIAATAGEHLAALTPSGSPAHPGEPRVDAEDLGVFVVVQITEQLFDRPVMFASGDQDAAHAAAKAGLATVTRYTSNHTTGRLHAAPGSVRLTTTPPLAAGHSGQRVKAATASKRSPVATSARTFDDR